MLRAAKAEVLDQMSNAALIVVLKCGTGVDGETQLDTFFGPCVSLHVIAQAILKATMDDRRIERNWLTDNLCRAAVAEK